MKVADNPFSYVKKPASHLNLFPPGNLETIAKLLELCRLLFFPPCAQDKDVIEAFMFHSPAKLFR